MRTGLLLTLLIAAGAAGIDAQRKPGAGLSTLAIMVTDPSGTLLTGVKVTVDGPASRTTRPTAVPRWLLGHLTGSWTVSE